MLKPICSEGKCNDRSDWPPGDWDNEPDRVDFTHAGFACLLHRGPLGAWCGYVGVPKDHPYFGKEYDHVAVEVHGGLTFASECHGHVCHIADEEVWWFGFDCSHAGDLVPGLQRFHNLTRAKFPLPENFESFLHESYKDLNYVKKETISLAQQLAQIK